MPDPTPAHARKIAYTVRAECPDRGWADRYLAWLTGGHIQAVIAGGAEIGHAVRMDTEPASPVVEVRYVFPNRAAYDRYVEVAAPRLRAEGVEKFGPHTGIRMTRSLGEIHPPS